MKSYTEAAKRFYKSRQWQTTRALYARSVDGLCERCRAAGRYVPGKIVHHKEYLDDRKLMDPSVSLSWSNLELLCQDCHNKEHHSADNLLISYHFDIDGHIVPND